VSARDELAKTLYVSDNWRRKQAAEDWETEPDVWKQSYYRMADAALAAGFRRFRFLGPWK